MTKQENDMHDQYFQKLPQALLNFQFIEETMRMYIANCYAIINMGISQHIPFKYSYKDLEKDAFGTLVRKFKKYNNNTKLIEKTERLRKKRNYCAHAAYLLTYEQQNDPEHLNKETEKLETIIRQAKECRSELHVELQNVTAIIKTLKDKNKNV